MHDLIPLGPARSPWPRSTPPWPTPRRRRPSDPGSLRVGLARDFAAWCASRGATALPAHVGIVAAYLSWLADSGRKASTIGRRAASIAYHNKIAGHEPPTNQEEVRAVLRGIRRTVGTAREGKAPATADALKQMLVLCSDTLAGHRDRALLALGFAGAFQRSELVALQVEDLAEAPDGLRVTIRRSKTDQEGQGTEVAILPGCRLRPVEAVQSWLAAAEISAGPSVPRVSEPRSASCAGQLLRALACLRHALHDRLGIQFRLALPPLVVASRRMLGHGLHFVAGSQAGHGQQSSRQ
jgi:hypothetical protein